MLRKLGALLAFIGIGISSYLSYVKFVSEEYVCGISSCGIVNNSEYSYLFGIPVAYYGLLFYITLLVLILLSRIYLQLLLATFGLLFSAYLTYLEIYVIHAWCQWCVFSAWISLGLFIVSLKIYLDHRKEVPEVEV